MPGCKFLKILQHLIERPGISAHISKKHLYAGHELRDHGNQKNRNCQDDHGKCNDHPQPSGDSGTLHLLKYPALKKLDQRIQDICDHKPRQDRIDHIDNGTEDLPQDIYMGKEKKQDHPAADRKSIRCPWMLQTFSDFFPSHHRSFPLRLLHLITESPGRERGQQRLEGSRKIDYH